MRFARLVTEVHRVDSKGQTCYGCITITCVQGSTGSVGPVGPVGDSGIDGMPGTPGEDVRERIT